MTIQLRQINQPDGSSYFLSHDMSNLKPSVEYVKDIYLFCREFHHSPPTNDRKILESVNEELLNEGYSPFLSIKALKSYIKVD